MWRLEMLGLAAGERWKEFAALWQGRANGTTSVFNDIHCAVTMLRAGDDAGFAKLRAAMVATSRAGAEQSPTWREIGLPVVDGLREFTCGNYAKTVEHLLPARLHLARMGGSHAQRDIIDWTLTEAAIRGCLRAVALVLTNERLALRPKSAPNRRFVALAEAIA